jgi:hypothetical protein
MQGIAIFQKRDQTIRATITGPGDITGAKIWFTVKRDKADIDTDALITKKSQNNGGSDADAKVTDGPNGIVEVYIARDDTDHLDPGDYWYDVVIENVSGKRMQAVVPSTFTIMRPGTLT